MLTTQIGTRYILTKLNTSEEQLNFFKLRLLIKQQYANIIQNKLEIPLYETLVQLSEILEDNILDNE